MLQHRYSKKDIKYMQLCKYAADLFSTCAKRKYAAVLIDSKNHVVGMGYNGGPSGFDHCEDGGCPRYLENSSPGSSYDNCISIHAEQNALLHCDYSLKPLKLYVNGPPCFTCAKLIANSTVEKVFYLDDQSYSYDNWNEVQSFLNKANVETVKVDIWQQAN